MYGTSSATPYFTLHYLLPLCRPLMGFLKNFAKAINVGLLLQVQWDLQRANAVAQGLLVLL